jgi:uncharacterized protein DUF6541
LGGLLVGAIVLVHGSELYTAALLLVLVLLARWRYIAARRLPADLGLGVLVALGGALLYLPVLLHWAGGGGAIDAGSQDGGLLESGLLQGSGVVNLVAGFAINAAGVDFPLRLVLMPIGVWWSFRQRRGRLVFAATAVFAALTLVLSVGMGMPLARSVYAITFPWGMSYRLLMLVGVGLALLGGAGAVAAADTLGRWATQPRLGRLARVLVGTWLVLGAWALTYELRLTASAVNTTSADDEAAMAWLRGHARPGEVLANDHYADTGIWAPFKAGVNVLMARDQPDDGSLPARSLVLDNIAKLEDVPAARAAACGLGVTYVYHGAQPPVAGWEPRQFPALETLRASAALEEVFSRGDAAIFRTRLDCARP